MHRMCVVFKIEKEPTLCAQAYAITNRIHIQNQCDTMCCCCRCWYNFFAVAAAANVVKPKMVLLSLSLSLKIYGTYPFKHVVSFCFILLFFLLNNMIFATTCLQMGFVPFYIAFSLFFWLLFWMHLIGRLSSLETCTTVTKMSKHKKAKENWEVDVHMCTCQWYVGWSDHRSINFCNGTPQLGVSWCMWTKFKCIINFDIFWNMHQTLRTHNCLFVIK